MNGPNLTVLTSLPDGFLECGSRDLLDLLGGPTLIHLPGTQPGPPLFISTLLHGNETTGIDALQHLFGIFGSRLPRPVSIFIGNVEAAHHGERFLPGQRDYNRIWSGGSGPENIMAQQVIDAMVELNVCACIDIHNNTGKNPHYSIVSVRDTSTLAMASRFSNRVVHAAYPETSCSLAFSRFCPSITVEAGVVGDASGIDHVINLLTDCIEADVWRQNHVPELDMFHAVGVIKLNASCSIGLIGDQKDIELLPDVDRFNFQRLASGTKLGLMQRGRASCLRFEPMQSDGVLTDYLDAVNGELRSVQPIMPAMLTTDCEIIKMDCLCYLMEPIR